MSLTTWLHRVCWGGRGREHSFATSNFVTVIHPCVAMSVAMRQRGRIGRRKGRRRSIPISRHHQ
jgi:hypothetical protein